LRIATYLGLVLRRIWARKLMLLGSFLGATLVTALLVVLPLYESSVAAIDLLFTFRQAPDTTVNLSAVQTTTEYSAGSAEAARQAVDQASAGLATWYPDREERTVSRELVLIPLGTPDWLQLAEDWREEIAGLEPDERPDPPYPTPPPEATQTRLFTAPDLTDRIEIIAGDLVTDQDPRREQEPVLRVVLGERLALLAQLEIGDRIVLRPFVSLPDQFEVVEVSGLARAADPTAFIWDGTDPERLVYLDNGTFDTWAVPVPFDEEVDPWLRSTRGFQRLTATQTFTLQLDREAVSLENVQELSGAITAFTRTVARAEGITTISKLPDLIEEFDVRTVVFGAPIVAMLALIVAGALYFLIYMAALALERESTEISLLRSRGASAWQTVGIHLLQSSIIAVAAVLVAPIVSRLMVSVTGRIPPMSELTGGDPLAVSQARSIIPFALAGGVLTFMAMGLAILPLARRTVLELRTLASRPARQSVWQRYYLDIFLVVLAAVILYELRQQGLVDTDTEDLGLDPFSVAAPALFLFSGALLMLRVLPLLLRFIGWVMSRFRGMTTALPGWHLGRNPIPYGRLALLVWLTTGFGAFALTYAATLEKSYDDRAGYAAGSDMRIVDDEAAYLTAPEGAVATPVFRSIGSARLSSRTSELLAVDPAVFPSVVSWRDDFAEEPVEVVLGRDGLGGPVDWGVELQDGTTSIRVTGVQVPRSWRDQAEDGPAEPVRLMARVVDEQGRFRLFAADAPFDGTAWQRVEISLSGGDAINGPFTDAGGALVLQAVWVERDTPGSSALDPGAVLIDDVTAVTGGGETSLDDALQDEMEGIDGLSFETAEGDTAVNAYYAEIPADQQRPTNDEIAASPLQRSGTVMQLSTPGRTRAEAVPHLARPPEPLEFVLDGEAAAVSGLRPGTDALFGVEGEQINGLVTGLVDLVPTTGDARFEGVIVTRLDGLMQWISGKPPWSLTGTPASRAQPGELWVATEDQNAALRTVLASLPEEPEEVFTTAGVSSDFSSRPIQVGLVSILFVGTGAGVVLALAGVTGYVLVAVRRRYREMGVLRALGLRRRSVAGTFALEQLVVLGLGALIGVGAGIGLMRLMIPFLQLGEEAENLLPPVQMIVSTGQLGLYLGIVTVLLVTSVLWSTRSVSARRLSEVLREVER
jgi:hypothetical protein